MNEYESLVPEGNEYDGLIDEMDNAQSTVNRVSLAATKDKNPDQQAEIYDLASRSKIPADVVARNVDEVRSQVEANEYDKLLSESPELAGWMSNPENAALSKDDIGPLSKISSALKWSFKNTTPLGIALSTEQGQGFAESLSRVPQTITKSLLTDPVIEFTDEKARPRMSTGGVSDFGYTDPLTGKFIDTGIQSGDRFSPAEPSFAKELNTIARGINESLKVDAEASGETLPESVKQQRTTPGINSAKILENLGQIPAYAIALFTPGKTLERGLSGVKALSQVERAAIAGAASNAAIIGSQTYNDAYQAAYDNYIATGLHPEEAAYKAQYQAQKAAKTIRAIAAVTGALGEGSALASASLKEIPKAALKGAATEIPEELSQSALTKAAAGEHLTQDEVIEIAALSAILGGGVGGAMAGANVYLETQRKRGTESIKAQQSIDDIAAAAQQSKLLQRSPEKFKEAVREFGQKSGQEAVYIPVDALTAYYQSKNIDPGAEVARITGNAEAYQEAISTGADIKVPIENFASAIAPEHYEGLKPHIRTSPEAMTPTEAAEFEQNQDSIAAGFVDTNETTDTSPQVYDAVMAELVDAGIETKAAEKQAKLYASVFRSMGQRTGLDPVTLYNRYGLTVSRADMPTVERRKDDQKRQIIEGLPAEQRATLLKSDVIPSLLGKRAYEMHVEQNPADRVMFFDFDDFKLINDKAGEEETDRAILAPSGAIIQAVAEGIGIKSFHRSGDEFLAAGATDEQLENFAKTLRERLKSAKFIATLPDGREETFNGIGFSYGIEGNEKSARKLAKQQKIQRREAGERSGARDSDRLDKKPPTGNEVPGRDTQTTLNQAPSDEGVSVSGRAGYGNHNRKLTSSEKEKALDFFKISKPNAATKRLNSIYRGHASDSEFRNVQHTAGEGYGGYFSGDKKYASGYGKVKEYSPSEISENRLVFDTLDDFKAWEQYVKYDVLGYKRDSEFNKDFSLNNLIYGELGFDGLQFGQGRDATFVDYRRAVIEPDKTNNPAFSKTAPKGAVSDLGNKKVTTTKAFRDWFGDSKVVDESGKPLVVYHGTSEQGLKGNAFDKSLLGSVTKSRSAKAGFFFVGDEDVAKGYSRLANEKPVADLIAQSEKAERQGKWDLAHDLMAKAEKLEAESNPKENVVEAYLSIQNPFEFDASEQRFLDIQDEIQGAIREAKAGGHDGIVLRNLIDNADWGRDDATDHWIAFEPTQIKATANRGTFDPNDPNILNQKVFHGTPHKFDKFSLDAMGTGEGVQAYGWGLYFAGEKAVAEFYRDNLSKIPFNPDSTVIKGKTVAQWADALEKQADRAKSNDERSIINEKRLMLQSLMLRVQPTAVINEAIEDGVSQESINWFRDIFADEFEESGNVYQAEIPDDKDLLDWNKKIKDQPEAVRRKLDEFDFGGDKVIAAWKKNGAWPHVSGETLYRKLSDGLTVGAAEKGKHKQASMMLNSIGIPGLRYLDENSRNKTWELKHPQGGIVEFPTEAEARDYQKRNPEYTIITTQTANYVIWDEKAVTVEAVNEELRQARELFQPPPPLDGTNRGQIKFNDQRTQFSILLFKNADMSTLLHESGHFYLEVLGDIVRRGEATPQIAEDYQAILKWMGSDGKITSKQHEQFARGFEAYLMEGKAPSVELQGVFARFRAWLVQIYRTVKNLDVELSDEIRQVFDRLVATEDEIAAAEQAQDYRVVFGDNPVLQKIAAEAREAATTKLANQAMKEITRQEKATWKENRKRVMAEVASKVDQRPIYQVLAYLSKGTLPDGSPLPDGTELAKLSKKALLAKYEQEWITRNLFKKRVYTNDGGVDPESLAPVYGFPSGDAMVQAIAAAEPRETVIERETDAEMKRQYGDMTTDGTIQQKAMEAVHNSKREELLLAELRAIRKKQREVAPFINQAEKDDRQARLEAETILPTSKELRFIKASAEQIIGQKKVRDINANLYRVAEAKASRIAFEAAAKGDYETAYNAKLQQIRNHALYRAATKAKADSESVLRFLKRFQKNGLRSKLGKVNRLEQVDMLLDRYDLRKRSNKAIDSGKAKLELLTQIQGGLLTAPKSFSDSLRGNDKVNYRDETIESLRGLRDVLQQMKTEAMNEFEIMVNNERMDLNERADEMADTVMTTQKSVIPAYGEMSPEEGMKEFGNSLINAWLRTPSLARLLDNDQRGAWTRNIIEPIRRAVVEKLEPMKDKAQKALAKLYSDHYSVKEMVKMNERVVVPGINMSLTKWDLISLALNWGNADNRKAILESTYAGRKPFTEAAVMRAFQTMDKRDWDFVQNVWNYVDSYWPEIKEAQRRRRGISPPKVEAEPFTVMTKEGDTITLNGGYYPLKYDAKKDAKSRQHEMDDAFEKMRVGTLSSTQTKYGHTQERLGSGGQPVNLSMGVLHNHINNVIMDIALGDAVGYVDKVLARPQVKQALIDTDNLDVLESFKLWLKDVATGEMAPRSGMEQAARFVRLGFTKSKIIFNAVTIALQITGLPQTMVVTGKENFAKGAMQYAKNPRAAIRQVMSQSKMMNARYELGGYNKEVQGVYEALGNKGAPTTKAENAFLRNFIALFKAVQIPPWLIHAGFYGMKTAQLQVDTITWLAGYEQAKSRDLPHDEAVRFADGVLENAQTSGMWNDRAPIERGTLSANTRQNEFVKLLTTLGSYMIAKGNIAAERYKATNFKDVGQALAFGGDMMMLFTVEAILAGAIRGQWPEDDEDWWWWTTKQSGKSALSTIPILREFPAAMEGFSTGGPLGGFMGDLGKAGNQVLQGEIDLALFKSFSNVIGTMTGYPSAQFNRMVDAYWRESEGQDVSPIEYAVGRRN